MTITQLQYIVAVDTYKSFAKAAGHCYVSQPALSMQIKKIEEELDVLIFDRSRKPVITTDIGTRIVEHSRVIMKEIQRMPELVKDQKDEISGTLRVGIIPTLSPYLLPLFVTDFMAKYSDITLVFEELLSEEVVEKLNNDQLDVGILATPLHHKSIIEIPLFYEEFIFYGASDSPLLKQNQIALSDLNISDMWLLKHGHCFRSQSINICPEKQNFHTRRVRFESGSLETLKKMVESRFGYTILPELSILDMNDRQKKHTRKFETPMPMREISMVTHRSFVKKRLIEILRDEILQHIPNDMKSKERGRVVEISN